MHPVSTALATAALALAAQGATAASVWLEPASTNLQAGATIDLTLMLDFSAAELTVGGGIDIDIGGPLAITGFTPSAWFLSAGDPAFSGHSATQYVTDDYEVHVGHFNGLSGRHALGTLRLQGLAAGVGTVVLTSADVLGGFYSAIDASELPVTWAGAQVNVSAVPEPATLATLLAGLGLLAGMARRQRVV